jgi:hypothetical protein
MRYPELNVVHIKKIKFELLCSFTIEKKLFSINTVKDIYTFTYINFEK